MIHPPLFIKKYAKVLCGIILALFFVTYSYAQLRIDNIRVESAKNPIGIDTKTPSFNWQLQAVDNQRGQSQSAYQIEVKDPHGFVAWNSGKINSGNAVGIVYAGSALKASTKYDLTIKVWDQLGRQSTSNSWFETGLMNPNISAWEGASWIGGSNEDLVLYAKYLPLFVLNCDLTIAKGSTRAGIILGANDPRLMDPSKNILGISSAQNQSYLKMELDISAVNGTDTGLAKLHFYRVGYTGSDKSSIPVKTFAIKNTLINQSNKNAAHHISIRDQYGELFVTINNDPSQFIEPSKTKDDAKLFVSTRQGASVNLNPMGRGHDYISFGMLCDIGFSVDSGQTAQFQNLQIKNLRNPANTLFNEDLTKNQYEGIFKQAVLQNPGGFIVNEHSYLLNGKSKAVFVVADPSRNSMPMLRTQFSLPAKKIAQAKLYITSRGIYEVFLNGQRVGNDHFNPGLTQYNLTHLYQTYDVTNLVSSGQNALGAMLGEGWWSGLLSFGAIWNHFGDRQSLLAKLVISYSDGSKKLIVSNDQEWKYYNDGPIVYSSLDMGEVYDATKESAIKNWSTANFDDRKWKRAVTVPLDGTVYQEGSVNFMGEKELIKWDKVSLIGQVGENAGVYQVLSAKSVKQLHKSVFVYNMGQNLVGMPKIRIRNGKAGQKITIRVSEVLYPNLKEYSNSVGELMTENYRAALSQDLYIMKDGDQIIEPHFTSHGYQYIEISGLDQSLPLEAVQALCMSSIKKLTANYETSNQQVNKLWSNLVWSNIDNFLSIPTDCPQRNERMGWSGDISVFSRTATYVSNSNQFLKRHMMAMRDVQTEKGKFTDIAPVGGGFGGLLWGSAGITVPWEAYQQYNNLGLLQEHYPAMVKYINYLDASINQENGFCTDKQLGDWLGPQNNQLGNDYLVTAYHVYDLEIMQRVATLLGKQTDAARFKKMHEERKAFFNKTFVNADKKAIGLIGGGGFGAPVGKPIWKLADIQTAYAVGLALNVFSEENIPFMVKNLKETIERENRGDDTILRPKYSLMTGFIGTAWISKALSDHGLSDLAYQLLQNDQYPSWLYAVNQGATTIWERLNGFTTENGFGGNNSMNSFNHYSFGAIGQWMIAYSIGIQRDEPGFKKFLLQPEPDPSGKMKWAKGYYDCEYGRINSEWKIENQQLIYTATVPVNTTATLYLPAKDPASITESGKPIAVAKGIRFIEFKNGKAVYELPSGNYRFIAAL